MKQKSVIICLLICSITSTTWAIGDGNQTGHYIGGIGGGGGYTGGGNDNPIGGAYAATVRWNGHGNNYELVTYNTLTMASCQNHVNAAAGVGALIQVPCHYVP